MLDQTISIALDPETARAYRATREDEREKIQALVRLWLRELTSGDLPSLQQAMDEAAAKAQARGLTPEILDSLLKEA